ncbi:ECF transporter S component [Candidatus Bathyarchaeota archaeon]|nr:ECF transporter S component [Candidatus Bathyarchaeota archaeon]
METGKRKEAVSIASRLSMISISAALYVVAIALTASIPTPWGVGQFRPGVLIPAFFALVYGPIVGGMGAAIGTFVAEAITGFANTTPLLSLIAGVPANFVGFYLLGWFGRKYSTWGAFVITSFISLTIGNLIAALGVVGYFSLVFPIWSSWATDVKIGAVLGLTFFWVVTMIPFVIPVMPALLRATKPLLSARGNMYREITWGSSTATLKSTIIVSTILATLYVIVLFTPLGDLMFSETLFAAFWVKNLILIASVVVIIYGLLTMVFLRRKKTVE